VRAHAKNIGFARTGFNRADPPHPPEDWFDPWLSEGTTAGVFAEDREDLRIEWSPRQAPEIVRTASAGVVVRTARGEAHRSVGAAPGTRRLPADDPLRWLERVAERIQACAPGDAVFALRWIEHVQEVLARSETRGACRETRRARRLRVEVRVSRGPRTATATADAVLRPGREPDAERLARAVVDRAARRLSSRPATPGRGAVVLAPGVAGMLVHELVGHALEGDTVARGGSPLARERPRFSCTDLRVIDDPRRSRAPWRADDEGEPAAPALLIDEGRIVGHLLDRASANALGGCPTGHARRSSYLAPIRPRMGCTFIAAGRLDPREILDSVDRGVYVRRMDAAAVDLDAGAATFRVTDADDVERGAIGDPLDPFLMTLTVADLIGSLDRIGNDLEFDVCVGSCVREGQPLSTSVGAPTIRLRSASILS